MIGKSRLDSKEDISNILREKRIRSRLQLDFRNNASLIIIWVRKKDILETIHTVRDHVPMPYKCTVRILHPWQGCFWEKSIRWKKDRFN